MSPEWIHKSKIEKVVDQLQPMPCWAKKVGELWYTNKKVIDVHTDPPKCTFFGRLFPTLGVVTPSNFFTRNRLTRACQHTTQRGRGSPQIFNAENLKFGLKFSMCASITLELMGVSWQMFIQTTCWEAGVITWVQFLDGLGLPPKIWDGEKTFKIWRNFLQLSTWSRIFPEQIHKS